jgi:hypothetical protein
MPVPRGAPKCGREVCQSSPHYHRTPDERRRGGGKLHRGAIIDEPANASFARERERHKGDHVWLEPC